MKFLLKFVVVASIILCCGNVQSQEHPQIIKSTENKAIEQKTPRQDTDNPTQTTENNSPSPDKFVSTASPPVYSYPTNCHNCQNKENWVDRLKSDPIATFTGLLFLATVGLWAATCWLVLRTDKMNRKTERAYLIGGGPVVKKDVSNSSIITIHNAGKTPGFLTKLQWKICLEEDFLPKVRVSKILKENLIDGITGDVIEEDNVWPASEKFGLEHFKITNHSEHVGKIFFGQVDFKDIFGDSHYSTFKLKLHKGGSRTLPGSYSDDWG